MIPEIKTLVGQRGSRTHLMKPSKAQSNITKPLMIFLPDDDSRFSDEWIEELALSVSTFFAVIEAYLNDWKDDTPSTLSSEKRKGSQKGRERGR